MTSYLRQVRNLPRFRKIASVFARHGFGSMIEYLELDRYLSLPRSILKQPAPEKVSVPEHLRLALEELGPTFIKLGQVISTRPDILPPEYIRELNQLTDSVAPLPWEDIRPVFIEELGEEPEQLFASIDPDPLGSASLAQVHSAELPSGEEVVVKIQRPSISDTIRIDLEILEDAARLAQLTPLGEAYQPLEVVNEFSNTIRSELNYLREARNADQFRENFKGEDFLVIPKVYWEFCNHSVIVLERIRGIRIDDLEALDDAGYDRHRIAMNATHLIMKEVFEDGFFHADPHPGNLYVMNGSRLGAMDFGMVGRLSRSDRMELFRLFSGAVQMDAGEVVDQLVRMEAVRGRVDRRGLSRDIERLLQKYDGLPLSDIHAGDVFEDLMPITFRHNLSLPPNFWLLAKSLTILEGMGTRLDPDFNPFEVSEPYIRKLSRLVWDPREISRVVFSDLSSWGHFLSELPRVGSDFLRDIRQARAPIVIDVQGSRSTLDRVDRMITRLSLSLLIAGLVIGLAMILPAALDNTFFLIVIITGFISLFAMGLWLIISILRTGR